MSEVIELKPNMKIALPWGDQLSAVRQLPYFSEYLGLWAMQEREIDAFSQLLSGFDFQAHMASGAVEIAAAEPVRQSSGDGIGIVELRGTMMKQRTSMMRGTSTVAARRAIRSLDNNPDVGSIVLLIESPGGAVSGTRELALDVAGTNKPVVAYIEDLGASAAYWVASAADEVYSNETAAVGSIGTYGVVYDASEAAEKAGIKVTVVRAGEFKGMLTPGTEITKAQLALLQEQVDTLNGFFLDGVSEGRDIPMEQVKNLANGRTWIGSKAVDMKLTDGVKTFDQVLARAEELASSSSSRVAASVNPTEVTMSDTKKPVAATVDEIQAAYPSASSDFVLAQVKQSNTMEQVKDAWIAELTAQHEADRQKAHKEHEEMVAKLEAAEKKAKVVSPQPAVGAKPVSQETGNLPQPVAAGNAGDQWHQLMQQNCASGMSAAQSMDAIDKQFPGLREKMVQEDNSNPDWSEADLVKRLND